MQHGYPLTADGYAMQLDMPTTLHHLDEAGVVRSFKAIAFYDQRWLVVDHLGGCRAVLECYIKASRVQRALATKLQAQVQELDAEISKALSQADMEERRERH